MSKTPKSEVELTVEWLADLFELRQKLNESLIPQALARFERDGQGSDGLLESMEALNADLSSYLDTLKVTLGR